LLRYLKVSCFKSLGDWVVYLRGAHSHLNLNKNRCLQTMTHLGCNHLFDCLEGFTLSFIAKVLIDARWPESDCYLPKPNLFCPNSMQVTASVLTLSP
jgi:hypothetical protein